MLTLQIEQKHSGENNHIKSSLREMKLVRGVLLSLVSKTEPSIRLLLGQWTRLNIVIKKKT
jgi:hypothetical protein